jgi:dTDP-4-dehydrorhamnose reductase
MNILVTGSSGQVGQALLASLAGLGEVTALNRAQLDLADLDAVRAVVRSMRPALIINAAAYTAVDQAESEPALALRINGEAPRVLAEEAKKIGAALIHYSTDYVFDGSKAGAWTEDDQPAPLSVYGSSKLAGEQAIAASGAVHLILRTSWVYGLTGKNFLLTMLRLAQTRPELSIVNDQIGAPTWSHTIAEATAQIVRQAALDADYLPRHSGTYHLSAGGSTSWFGFAEKIFAHESAGSKPALHPITTADYPLPAKRPHNSVLNTTKFQQTFCSLPQWDQALAQCQQELRAQTVSPLKAT